MRRAHHHAFDQRLTADVRTGNAIGAENRGLVRHRPQYSAVGARWSSDGVFYAVRTFGAGAQTRGWAPLDSLQRVRG